MIANRSDGGILYWVAKLYVFAAAVLVVAVGITGFCTYGHFATQAKPAPDFANYSSIVPAVSRIYAADGTLLGEFANEWREVASYSEIPEGLVNAFVAAEDHEFFVHHGIYFKGIIRAAWRNLTAGDFAQGGSTITQQVAKQFIGSEKSLSRKINEAIMARRIEALYSKKAILSVYMNQIFLGSGAYGVKAAAQRYFGKKLDELDQAEMALIAGLAQAPSRYSPTANPERAIERRNEILDRMARHGYLAEEEAERWKKQPLNLHPYKEVFGLRNPYYAEHVRRYVVDRYGLDSLMEGGLRIETAVEPVTDQLATDNVDFGARKQDKRQGWRGSVAFLDEGEPRELFIERSVELYGDGPLEPGRRYLALVEEVEHRGASVRIGQHSYDLPLSNMSWAAKWSAREAINDQVIASAREALRTGDVVWVSADQPLTQEFYDWHLAEGVNPRWTIPMTDKRLERALEEAVGRVRLEQVPHPQSAIFTGDHETGYVVAMVGGTDYDRSEYNRAIQACRQPGSTYKPIYYSAALDLGLGFDSVLNDVPRAEVDPVTGEVWTPQNLGGTVDTRVTLEYALVFSKNVPSVAVFKKVGAQDVERWARRLGFTTTIIADQALALGASCTVLDELTRAFAIFARNGRWLDWIYVRRILDRDGNALEDRTAYYDPMLDPGDRLDRVAATAGVRARQAIPARAAYLTTVLLREVITHGFSSVVRRVGINAAGKTGTSSATMDTSFVAFTSRWITAVWLGDDIRQRPLGLDDAAYMTVVPMWARYMNRAAAGHPNRELPVERPAGVNTGDRGDNKGETMQMPLIYIKHGKPEDAAGSSET